MLETIVAEFGPDWLASGADNAVVQLWQRKDWLATSELLMLGDAIQNLRAIDAPWTSRRHSRHRRNGRFGLSGRACATRNATNAASVRLACPAPLCALDHRRYRPSIWRRVQEGDLDHVRALIEAFLAVIERVLPEQFLEKFTVQSVFTKQPG